MHLPPEHGWDFWRASNARARAAGIRSRPYDETIADALAWRREQEFELQAGLTPEQERRLIDAWRDRRGT